jgi:hypothetical protein
MELSPSFVARITTMVGQLKMAPSRRDAVYGEALCIGASRSSDGPFIRPMAQLEMDIVYELSSSSELAKAAQGIPWSSIQFVRGGSQWHKDTGNIGKSLIMTFGDFEGGAFLHGKDSHDVKGKALIFDGSISHCSAPHKGDRTVVILFLHSAAKELPAKDRVTLELAGFPWRLHPLRVKEPPPIARSTAANGVYVSQILYLYAGAERRASIKTELDKISETISVQFVVTEKDILQADGDLLDDDIWNRLRSELAEGKFDVTVACPPCETMSRALHSGRPGPKPLKDFDYPSGFPWLQASKRRRWR